MVQIKLRKIDNGDFEFLIELYNNRDPREKSPSRTINQQQDFFKSFLKDPLNHVYSYLMIVEADCERAGSITLKHKDNECGLWLIPKFRCQGIGKKALRLFFDLCDKKTYTGRIWSYNKVGIHNLDKLNFVFVEKLSDGRLKYVRQQI